MKTIFVIDMINGFCKEGALHDKKILRIVPNIIKELEAIPVQQRCFIVDCHSADCMEFASFPPHCLKGTNESKVIDELLPYCERVVEKNATNAAHVLDFHKEMIDVDEVIITGCCSDICILQFTLTLKTWCNQNDRNIKITIPQNCIATYDIPEVHDAKIYHEFAIKLMQNAGINII